MTYPFRSEEQRRALVPARPSAHHGEMDAALVGQIGLVLAVLTLLWVLPDWATHRERLLRWGRRLHLVDPEPPHPLGPPIERIAADVRRIREQIQHVQPGFPVARMRGWLEAYDDVLVEACRALELDQRLTTLPPGVQRVLERERVERLLIQHGLLERRAG